VGQVILYGLRQFLGQLMRSFNGHLSIDLDVKLDKSEVSRLPRAKVMITVNGTPLRFDEIPDPGLLLFGQVCIQ
jgi:predicted NAD/FAD-binding protein